MSHPAYEVWLRCTAQRSELQGLLNKNPISHHHTYLATLMPSTSHSHPIMRVLWNHLYQLDTFSLSLLQTLQWPDDGKMSR